MTNWFHKSLEFLAAMHSARFVDMLTLIPSHAATAAERILPRLNYFRLDGPAVLPPTLRSLRTQMQPASTCHSSALRLTETEMTTEPAVFSPRPILGRDLKWFPGVAISFFTRRSRPVYARRHPVWIRQPGT